MTRLVWPVVILLLMLLAGSAWSLFGPLNLRQFLRSNTAESTRATVQTHAAKTQPLTSGTMKLDEAPAAASSKLSESASAESLPAEFDIARIDSEGTSVFAGRTLPNANVTVMGDGREVGSVKADENGEWTLAVDYKFASDDPELAIVAKRASEAIMPGEKRREIAVAASAQDAPQQAAGDQRTTSATEDTREPGAQDHQKASTITANLLKNLEDMVETARTAARQPTKIEPKDPVPARAEDAATVNIEASDATPAVSQVRSAPAAAPPASSPTVSPASSTQTLAAASNTDPPVPETSTTPPSRKTIPVPITFIFNESTLTEDGKKAATLLLEYLQIKNFPKVSLTGHADERGTDELNMSLSRARLATVERFLRDAGFEGELELLPKGETEPFKGVERSEYELEDLYQLDRRVELIITQ